MASNISLQIAADVSSAVKGIQSVAQQLSDLKNSSSSGLSAFTSLATGVASTRVVFDTVAQSISKVVSVASNLISAYASQEQAEMRLQTMLKATQNACGMTAAELLDLAEALSEVTTYAAGDVLEIENVLIATENLGRDVVPEATKAVLNLASATGRDATQAARQLSRALADPAKNINVLNSAGLTLTSTQIENIKTVQEQSGIYEAQRLILDHVAATYGDMAEAIAQTDSGKLERIKNVWQDIKEGLGRSLLNTISPALDAVYESLKNIYEIIDNHNNFVESRNTVESALSSYNYDFTGLSDSELRTLFNSTEYGQWYNKASYELADFETNRGTYELNALRVGVWDDAGERFAKAILAELEDRATPKESTGMGLTALQNLWSVQDLVANDFGFNTDFGLQISNPFNTSSLAGYQDFQELKTILGTLQESTQDSFSSFMRSNGSLSSSYRISQIDDKIASAAELMASGALSDDQIAQLEQVVEALEKQKDALSDVEDGLNDVVSAIPDMVSQVMSFASALGDLFSTMADSAIEALEELQEEWDDYFEELDDTQAKQLSSMNALLASGNMSYEEYINALNALDEERAAAQAQAAAEEEEATEKANELARAAFIAEQTNAVAQVAMSTAQAIMAAWADDPNPVVAGIMTGLISATAAVQTAAILSQSYTPLAAGGIVQSPTHALIGEGGSPEAILPLTDANLDRFGLSDSSSGVINIVINIENSYSGDQLADDVFNGIERAQRTGALPKWRYIQ